MQGKRARFHEAQGVHKETGGAQCQETGSVQETGGVQCWEGMGSTCSDMAPLAWVKVGKNGCKWAGMGLAAVSNGNNEWLFTHLGCTACHCPPNWCLYCMQPLTAHCDLCCVQFPMVSLSIYLLKLFKVTSLLDCYIFDAN